MTVQLGPLPSSAAGELLTLQRAAYATEAQLYGDPNLPALVQSLDELRDELDVSRCTAACRSSGDCWQLQPACPAPSCAPRSVGFEQ